MRLRLLYIVIAWILGSARLLAQDPYYRVIDASDGLPNNEVYGIFQDKQGFIWITTDDGLCRFDGQTFKSYTSPIQSAKAGANIFEDKYGRIWYENFDGRLYYVVEDTLIEMQLGEVFGFTRSMALGDKLYFPRINTLDIYDLHTMQLLGKQGFGNQYAVGSNSMGESRYWIRTERGAIGIDSAGHQERIGFGGNTAFKWSGVTFDSGKQLYFLDYFNPALGLFRFDNGAMRPYRRLAGEGGLQHHYVKDGKLFVCYTRGMEVIDLNEQTQHKNRIYFPDRSISAVLIDRDGNYWLGTKNKGLLFVPDFSSQRIHFPSGGLSQVASSPLGLFVGTQSGDLAKYIPETQEMKVVATEPTRHAIDYLRVMGDQIVMASPLTHFLDIHTFERKYSRVVAVKDAEQMSPKYLAVTVSGSSGLMELPHEDSLPDIWDAITHSHRNEIERSYCDPLPGRGRAVAHRPGQDAAYYATSNGLIRLTPEGSQEITWQDRHLFGANMDADSNHIYLRTTQGQLFVLDRNDGLHQINDLPVPPPYGLLKLVDGKLYLVAGEQLLELDTRDPHLHVLNSFVGLETSSIHDIAHLEGKLALATDDGLVLLDPKRLQSSHKPEVIITGLHIAGRAWPADSVATVDYQDHEVIIDYAILNFRTLGTYPLYYRINDDAWKKANPETRQLLLAQLSPGAYDIQFCLGAPGTEIAARVQVHILRPFWMQIWFYVLCMALLGGCAALLVWRRGKVVQRNHQQKLEKLELENSLRQSTLAAIRSQMNPHFFFNALNTIQAYIFSDDKRNATMHLSKLSKLTRMVLEMSEQETVSLSEEIQAITLYLELEKSRFGDEFNFEIELGRTLSPISTRLPSMIIQPFVENAVKHGLLHQTGPKELRISFRAEDEFLVIVVDDNGIGRKRSEELNRIRAERHQSFSVSANRKRIDILNEGHSHIGVTFVDKVADDGRALGTTVTIKLPLILNPKS